MEKSKGLGRSRAGLSQGRASPPAMVLELSYLGRNAPELRVFAAIMPAVVLLVCEIAGAAMGVHLLHALLCLPPHQPTEGRQGVNPGPAFASPSPSASQP